MPHIAYVTRPCRDVTFDGELPEGGKFNPTASQPGGAAVHALPVLRGFGVLVDLYGWYTDDDEPFREFALAHAARWFMELHPGRGALNAIIPGPRVLRVQAGPPNHPPREASERLTQYRPAALIVTGKMPKETAEFWLNSAAALNAPTFWDAGPESDLELAGNGGNIYLQVSCAEHRKSGDRTRTPHALARELLVKSGSAGVIVTAAEQGAFAAFRGTSIVLHAPAISLDTAPAAVGCGDAHLAGFVTAFLQAPSDIRVERGLALGRIVAARHASGLAAADWHVLQEYVKEVQGSVLPLSSAG